MTVYAVHASQLIPAIGMAGIVLNNPSILTRDSPQLKFSLLPSPTARRFGHTLTRPSFFPR